jgi:hypothetical protein
MYIGNQPLSQAFVTDQFSGNGSTTAFTMSVAPANTASVLVAVSGVLQDPSTYSVSGTTLTFSAAPPSATGNISARYLGIPASGVTTTAYRTITEFTATAGQTTFTPASYTVGFIQVYRNGVLLGSADYTATNGTTVVLAVGATSGDLVTTISFYVSSVLNAIPATAGAVNSTYIANNAVGTAQLANGAVGNTQMASGAARANWGAGGILQVVQSTGTASQSTTSTSYVTTGLTLTITPSASTNKVLITYTGYAYAVGGNERYAIYRGATKICESLVALSGNLSSSAISYLDSPASTSPTTYTLYYLATAGTAYLNGDGTSLYSLTAMEVAA